MTSHLTARTALVCGIRRVRTTSVGNNVFELTLQGGQKVRTAANSQAGIVLSSKRPDTPAVRMRLLFNGRGTVQGIEKT